MEKTIYIRLKTPKGWRFTAVPTGAGKPPVWKKEAENSAANGGRGFQFRFADALGKMQWSNQYPTIAKAQAAAQNAPLEKAAEARGLTLDQAMANPNRVSLAEAVEKFLKKKSEKATQSTIRKYEVLLKHFRELSKVRFLEEITEDVLRKFLSALRQQGYDASGIEDHYVAVRTFLKKQGIQTRLERDEVPEGEDKPAVAYSEEELKKLFDAMDPEEAIRYRFFLGTGARDKEVTFASWADLNLDTGDKEGTGIYHVRSKPDAGFTVKNHEQRSIPIPKSLVDALKERKKNRLHNRWVFINEQGRPDNHFLRKLKRIALKAGVNCGNCVTTITISGGGHFKKQKEVTCATHPVCEHVFLHRFRKTCATRWSEANIPVLRIKEWLGHKDLSTTQLYLQGRATASERNQINKAAGD